MLSTYKISVVSLCATIISCTSAPVEKNTNDHETQAIVEKQELQQHLQAALVLYEV